MFVQHIERDAGAVAQGGPECDMEGRRRPHR